MSDLLIVLNAGSSSLKFALYELEGLECLMHGAAEQGASGAHVEFREPGQDRRRSSLDGGDFQLTALTALLDWLNDHGMTDRLAGAGHRVVHGGVSFTRPLRVDDESLARMDELVLLAPLHLPQNLEAIHQLRRLQPSLPQVACFDTAFHATQADVVRTYGLPEALTRRGYIRYGFHGLSYEYVASRLEDVLGPQSADGRVIVAHLGNGASLCALRDRASIATTFGYSTLDGLIMGTRCGALDPGLVLQLIRDHGKDPDVVERMLYRDAGLAGVSGISHDMRVLLGSDEPRARFAVDLFVYRIVRECGSLAAALGGVDAVIFTGGIGARAGEIRERVVDGLHWLGAAADPARNRLDEVRFESTDSRIALAALPTNEEIVVARHTRSLVA